MAQEPRDKQDDQGGGAPPWMVTYSDTVTLLLTFFVLMLTFSTPNKEDFTTLSRGFLSGIDRLRIGGRRGAAPFGAAAGEETRLVASRLDRRGAEHPPLRREYPLADLRYYYPDLDISRLKELRHAQTVRVPLERLFDERGALSETGRAILHRIVRMRTAKAYRLVVRARTAAPEEDVARAVAVARFLRTESPPGTGPVDVCDRDPLGAVPLPAGLCELILLEE